MDTHQAESLSRQLAVLRSTYPGWEIQRIIGEPEGDTWTAELRRELTCQMRVAGVKEHISAPDAMSLAATLSQQVALIHHHRARSWPG